MVVSQDFFIAFIALKLRKNRYRCPPVFDKSKNIKLFWWVSRKTSWLRLTTCQPSNFPCFRARNIIFRFKLMKIQGRIRLSDLRNLQIPILIKNQGFFHHLKIFLQIWLQSRDQWLKKPSDAKFYLNPFICSQFTAIFILFWRILLFE